MFFSFLKISTSDAYSDIIIESVVWRDTTIVRFHVNTSCTLGVKEIQFRLLPTTLLMFLYGLDKDMNSQCGPRNQRFADPSTSALQPLYTYIHAHIHK
jgi:hypothetical protein